MCKETSAQEAAQAIRPPPDGVSKRYYKHPEAIGRQGTADGTSRPTAGMRNDHHVAAQDRQASCMASQGLQDLRTRGTKQESPTGSA